MALTRGAAAVPQHLPGDGRILPGRGRVARRVPGRDDPYSGRADIETNGPLDDSDRTLPAASFGDSIEEAGGVARSR